MRNRLSASCGRCSTPAKRAAACNRNAGDGAGGDQFGHGWGASVEDDDRVALGKQVLGHGTSHHTQTDEADILRHGSSQYWRAGNLPTPAPVSGERSTVVDGIINDATPFPNRRGAP